MAGCVYDVCVIGAGLWGSAAAYHASLKPETKVCLIGPDEPTSTQEFSQRTIYGAYYDEARITRQNVENITDALLSSRSYEGFHILEKKAGISFYSERNHVLFTKLNCQFLRKAKKTSEFIGFKHLKLTSDELNERFPYITIDEDYECLMQCSRSGLVNPRKLVSAQKQAAKSQGCDVVTSIVDRINEIHDPVTGQMILEVVTKHGQIIRCHRTLLCTGGFTLSKPLLPPQFLPRLDLVPTQTMRFEVGADDVKILGGMPMMSSRVGGNNMADCYFCPPVRYPDGKLYLKIGHGRRKPFDRNDEIAEWYRSNGDPIVAQKMVGMLRKYIPGLQPLSIRQDTCVGLLTATPSGLPYIDMVTPQIGIAIGGNGVGARWSYEVGKMAARMITKGCWDYDLPKEHFKVQFQDSNQRYAGEYKQGKQQSRL